MWNINSRAITILVCMEMDEKLIIHPHNKFECSVGCTQP